MSTTAAAIAYDPFFVDSSYARALREEFESRGVAVLGPPALRSDIHAALVDEAAAQRHASAWDLIGTSEPGDLDQDNVRAHLGPVARELMASGAARALLQRITGRVAIPGWSATCLTFYDRPGSHLGRHTDKPQACGLALLIYLSAAWNEERGPGPGMQLHVESDRGLLRVTGHPNRAIVLDGARLAHYRPRIQAGERMALIAGCYEVLGSAG